MTDAFVIAARKRIVLNRWPELRRLTENGILEMENYTAKQTMRPCAIGRKNWLFIGSDRGGKTAIGYK